MKTINRRTLLKSAAASSLLPAAVACSPGSEDQAEHSGPANQDYPFQEVNHGLLPNDQVPDGYQRDVLISWGDPLKPGLASKVPASLSAEDQLQRFGANCDYTAFFQTGVDQAVLGVNHEFPNVPLLLNHLSKGSRDKQVAQVEQASCGVSMVGLKRDPIRGWQVDINSKYNRRISANTPCNISGPAAGHALLKTIADPTGTKVLGTLNNCAGGVTPWGTMVTCEENFDIFFGGAEGEFSSSPMLTKLTEYGLEKDGFASWHRHDERFHILREPQEQHRFGWVVEIDPTQPYNAPIKRTALGRFKHESAEMTVNKDGRVVVYMGDDSQDQCIYKYVSRLTYIKDEPFHNQKLLDDGTLFVAKLTSQSSQKGSLQWLELSHGKNGLTAANGFKDQAEVLTFARLAAKTVGATPMDRPEDLQPLAGTGEILVMLTNHGDRQAPNAGNPRPENKNGHILKIIEDGKDFTSHSASYEYTVLAGNPADPTVGSKWHPEITANGWFACPDNVAVDPAGEVWIATDQSSQAKETGTSDGLWHLQHRGKNKGKSKMFYRAPAGAEVCGPSFDDAGTTLFLAIQHPAYGGRDKAVLFPWPNTSDSIARSSVLAIRHQKFKPIGSL